MGRPGRMLPATLLGRVRLGAVVFSFLIVPSGFTGLDHRVPVRWLAVGVLAAVGLLVDAIASAVTGRTLPGDPVLSGVLVAVVGSVLVEPLAAFGLALCPLATQSSFGSTRSGVCRAVLLGCALPAAYRIGPAAAERFGRPWYDTTVLNAGLNLIVLGLLVKGMFLLLMRQERAAARNAALAATGDRLLNCRDLADADAVIWRTALHLRTLSPGVAVLGGTLDRDAVVVDAVAGPPDSAIGTRIPADAEPIRLPHGRRLRWRALRAGTRRVLFVGAARGVPDEVADAFAALGAQAALAEGNCVAHAELIRQTRHDELTELPNRGTLFSRLAAVVDVAAAGRDDDGCDVLMVIDLDDFKEVNDTYGHAAGDELLIAVAERLTVAVGGAGLAARFGGDEFALLLTGMSGSDEVNLLAEQVCRDLRAPVDVGTAVVTVGASVGMVDLTRGMTAGDHMRCADIAMYAAKARGKNRVVRFDPLLHGGIATVSAMEDYLANAVANGEITVEYQPQVELATGVCVGVVALPYWDHPVMGRIAPATFLPLAERTGRIAEVGAYILRTACRQGAALAVAPGGAGLRITIAIAVRDLADSGLAAAVADALGTAGLPADRLTLEIPASERLADDDIGLGLRQLTATGAAIALYGFGDGPLTALWALPLAQVSFDARLLGDGEPGARLDLITAAGRILGLRTDAVGVDTAEQYELLRAAGIGSGRGACFGAAMGARELTDWLGQRATAGHAFA